MIRRVVLFAVLGAIAAFGALSIQPAMSQPAELVAGDATFTVPYEGSIVGFFAPFITGGVAPYTFAHETFPLKGDATVWVTEFFEYAAYPGQTGLDTFEYRVTDGNGASDTGVITLEIGDPPSTETPVPTETPTATATETPTATPTEPTATSTSTETPEMTATSTHEPTATLTSTATSTSEPTASATSEPTATETTEAPTITETVGPAATETTEAPTATTTTEAPTPTSTSDVTEPGAAIITVTTESGGDLPDNTSVCLAGDCQDLDAIASLIAAAAPSGTQASFGGLTPGSYPLTALIDGVETFATTIEIVAGNTTEVTIVLSSQGDPATPVSGNPTTAPVDPDPTTAIVTKLPSTGTGGNTAAPVTLLLLLAGAMLVTGSVYRQRKGTW